jgi:hypothetical protein
MKPVEINTALKTVAEQSAIEEFSITDSAGHAYLTNTGVDFRLVRKSSPQHHFSGTLLKGQQKVVIQEIRNAKSTTAP